VIWGSLSLLNISVEQNSRPSLKTGPEDDYAHADASHACAPDKFDPVPGLQIAEIKHGGEGDLHEGKVDEGHEHMFAVPFLNVDDDIPVEHSFSKHVEEGYEREEQGPYGHQVKYIVEGCGSFVASP